MMFLLLVTVISMALAAIMSVIAWRIAGNERRRAEARVAALAADIHGGPELRPVGGVRVDDLELRPNDSLRPAASGAELFRAAQPRSGSRSTAVVAAGVFAIASVAALVIVLGGVPRGGRGEGSGTAHASTPPAPAAQPAPAPPLELVALGHEREGDRLTVRGVVRNPGSGAAFDRLTAVVFLFNREGGFLSTGRVTIESTALRPGGESTFVVTVPRAADVGRYRVSFRTDDRIVPHVDRREPAQARL
jgi:hypothetical protein